MAAIQCFADIISAASHVMEPYDLWWKAAGQKFGDRAPRGRIPGAAGYATLVGQTFTPDVFAAGVDLVGISNIITSFNSIPPTGHRRRPSLCGAWATRTRRRSF
jgi:hypothetical protein